MSSDHAEFETERDDEPETAEREAVGLADGDQLAPIEETIDEIRAEDSDEGGAAILDPYQMIELPESPLYSPQGFDDYEEEGEPAGDLQDDGDGGDDDNERGTAVASRSEPQSMAAAATASTQPAGDEGDGRGEDGLWYL